MQFDSLKASIANNSDQQPSIYMALCMVESLFDDMEEALGHEISQAPVGDDTLPNKLIWLSNTLMGIYADNQEDLNRNRARLDAAMKKLRSEQQALESMADDSRKLEQARQESAALQTALAQRKQLLQTYETTAAQCAAMKQELQQLHTFDPDAAQAQLTSLRQQIHDFSARKATLEASLQAEQKTHTDLANAVAQLEQQQQQLFGSNEQYAQRKAALEQDIAQHRSAGGSMDAHLAALEEEAVKLAAELDEKTAQAALQFDANNAFRTQTLDPALQKLAEARKGMDSLTQQKANADAEYKKLQSDRMEMVTEIAKVKSSCETLSQEVNRKQIECETAKETLGKLNTDKDDAVLLLSQLQKSVSDLRDTDLPELKTRLSEEEARKTELETHMEQTRQKHNRLLAENQRLTASVAETDKNLKATQEIYDALTATDSTKTKELESLEQKLKELQDKSDEEKYTIYKRQLEEKIASLEKLRTDCDTIKAEEMQLLADIQQLQDKRSKLLERRQTCETGKKAAETLLQQLAGIDTEAYKREVSMVSHQLALLETVYGKLSTSFAMINKNLGMSPFEKELPLNDQVKQNLNTLRACTDDLRCALTQCADSLKMEEK